MRIFLLFFLFLSASSSFADTTSTPLWNCKLTASLYGDGDFFLHYGRDSWKGHATLSCQTEAGEVEQKEVDITYNGAPKGFGVNENSVIKINVDIMTSNPPSTFQVYAYVFNKDTPSIVWRSETGGILVEAKVISEDIPGIQASLQQGNLYIR